jgi:membrane fusion protein, multidrug efflux system
MGLFSMTKKMAVLWTGAFLLLFAGCKPAPPPAPAPPKVQVLTISPTNVPIFQKWVGTLDGYPNAQIRAQVTGYLLKQDYVEGSKVKAGDSLFEIDPRPFQAVLDQALSKQAQDEAMVGKTDLDVKRYTPLVKEQAVSQEELDNALQANIGAKASVAADKAAVETARLNLGFTRITSLVDGIAGVAQAQVGDLLGPGGAVLTTVSTVDPIRAYFNINEQFYLTYTRQHARPGNKTPPESDIPLELILSDGSVYPKPGKWLFTSRQIDINTGTIQVAAVFENPDNMLRPGQYALVRTQTEMRTNALLVPQRAVTQLQGAYHVATVDKENKVHTKKVQVGNQIGSDWLIDSGLAPEDSVVVEGLQKVENAKEGTLVDPQPWVQGETNQTPSVPGGGKPE